MLGGVVDFVPTTAPKELLEQNPPPPAKYLSKAVKGTNLYRSFLIRFY